MRILLAGDTHGNTTHHRYLIDQAVANNCDRIFVLGDWGAWEHMPWGIEYVDRVDEYASKNNIMVYWLDGNHDKTSLVLEKYSSNVDDEGFLVMRSYIRYSPRGNRFTWGGVRFITLGGAYSVDKDHRIKVLEKAGSGEPQRYWFPEEEMSDEDMARILNEDSSIVDVILAHDKPRASNPAWNRKDIEECWPNQDRLQMAVRTLLPTHFFHGHLHYGYEDMIGRTHRLPFLRGMQWCKVTGINCDPSAAGRGYRISDSWQVFDTEDYLLDQALGELQS